MINEAMLKEYIESYINGKNVNIKSVDIILNGYNCIYSFEYNGEDRVNEEEISITEILNFLYDKIDKIDKICTKN